MGAVKPKQYYADLPAIDHRDREIAFDVASEVATQFPDTRVATPFSLSLNPEEPVPTMILKGEERLVVATIAIYGVARGYDFDLLRDNCKHQQPPRGDELECRRDDVHDFIKRVVGVYATHPELCLCVDGLPEPETGEAWRMWQVKPQSR